MNPVRNNILIKGRISNGVKPFVVNHVSHLKGKIFLPGDKSIAHRSLLISAISRGKTSIENFPFNKDCLCTLKAIQKLGIKTRLKSFRRPGHKKSIMVTVNGRGLYGLKRPKGSIFVGDSGTTLRLLLGILAGQKFSCRLTAGKSLSHRPMLRVNKPLRLMGARINAKTQRRKDARGSEEYPPITIRGGHLKPLTYRMPVASAQVKSAILLAGLYTKGKTRVIEPVKTRDHTERMLKLFKADLKLKKNQIVIKGNHELVSPAKIFLPADISSASFFIVMASIVPNSEILIQNVSLNPTRSGMLKVLKRMGADIRISGYQDIRISGYELRGDIAVKSSKLRGTIVEKEEIPSLIDELPILMVAACLAKGKTIFKGVEELRLKETDRIRAMSVNLIRMGANIQVRKSGLSEDIVIKGVKELRGAKVKSFSDHRTAMSMVIAGLKARGKTQIDDITCINKSFPDFLKLLKGILLNNK